MYVIVLFLFDRGWRTLFSVSESGAERATYIYSCREYIKALAGPPASIVSALQFSRRHDRLCLPSGLVRAEL